jgi:predicted Zn-dependent peptidase
LTLVVVPRPHLQTASAAVYVKVGSRYENRANNGLSHLLEHMLFRGTSRHPSAHELNLAVEEIGGTAYGATHTDFTVLGITLPRESLAEGVAILGDLLRAPRFADLAVEKQIIREEVLQSVDEEGRTVDVDDLSRRLLFGTHPLGLTIAGNAKNFERFGRRDLCRHLRRYYLANNMVLCLAGAVTLSNSFRWVREHFGKLCPGERIPARPPLPIRNQRRYRYVESPGSQTDIRILLPTFGESDPRRMALHILTRVIDDGMSSRLQRRICDEQGLAYEVFSVLEQLEDCGIFGVGATADHSKIPRLVEEVFGLLAQLVEERVERRELERAKQRYQWSLRALLDTADGLCSHFGTHALFDLESDLARLADAARGVTADQVRTVAREIIRPERVHVACVGMLNRRQRQSLRKAVDDFES